MIRSGGARGARHGHGRYGRTIARVTVDGRDAGEWLMHKGLGRPWR
ncbi:MAG: hypothetical protein ACO1OX_07910 [Novosphingobium sp.]